MTPNEMITLAKKRVKDATVDWPSLYQFAINKIFTKRPFKFARGEINYTHLQHTYDKSFNNTTTEKCLDKIISARGTTSFSIGPGGVPTPVSNTAIPLEYIPIQKFLLDHPDPVQEGIPFCYTVISDNDGTTGLHIGLYYIPTSDFTVWITGQFKPQYAIDNNPMLVLPDQFHDMPVDWMIHLGAEEAGKTKLSTSAKVRFDERMLELITWDRTVPDYHPKMRSRGSSRQTILFPPEFDRSISS